MRLRKSAAFTMTTSAAIRTSASRRTYLRRELRMSTSSTMQRHDVADDVGNVLNIALRHARIEGKRHNAVVRTLCTDNIAASIAEMLPVERMKMYGNEMDARADIAQGELLDELRAIDRKP